MLGAQAADDKKAGRIVIMDVKKLTPIADYFIICE
ncbi:MAG: RsfS/YbeB/iojap family protein, partial [bacterium]